MGDKSVFLGASPFFLKRMCRGLLVRGLGGIERWSAIRPSAPDHRWFQFDSTTGLKSPCIVSSAA
jgi:hypothetical protein